ncbi:MULTISPECIES: hypothetical protein [Olivibacter]|uniref:Uncharacterized protein n=1 Tax=Olivibacter oleidegradans TaxID=760123 RepID=A0ABV6HII4_9SPHI|nr:hypothetical protein [Olivibacter jilunii]
MDSTAKFNGHAKSVRIKTIEGHLTVTEIRAIKAMLSEQVLRAKVSRKTYSITEKNGLYSVLIQEADQSLVYGKIAAHRATFSIR